MTTERNPYRHRLRPLAPDRVGRGTTWRRDAARSEDPAVTLGWFMTGNYQTAGGPYDQWLLRRGPNKQAIIGAGC